MEEDHGEKEELGEAGHFRAGAFNPGPDLGRTFGNAEKNTRNAVQRRYIQARRAVQFGRWRIRNDTLPARPVDLKRHSGERLSRRLGA